MSTPPLSEKPVSAAPPARGWSLFTPQYIKQAKLLRQGVQKFLHYKRDVLKPERLAEIEALRGELDAAIAARDAGRIKDVELRVTKACDSALPPVADAATRDWVESLVTCAVIVFAIRAYFIQPFKIPTGSMQPTLNGIIASRMEPDQAKPNVLKQGWELISRGRNYVRVEAPCDGHLVKVDSDMLRQLRLFVTITRLHFVDGSGQAHTTLVWAPSTQLIGQREGSGAAIDSRNSGLWINRDQVDSHIRVIDRAGTVALRSPIPVKKGQVLAAGTVDSGDMVLVDKMSYHFRRPTRGEVFVFNTRNIEKIQSGVSPQEGSQHYIKRLTGLPGDSLDIRESEGPLYINGELAKEKGIRRVFEEKVPHSQFGYHGYANHGGPDWTSPPWGVPNTPASPMRGYFAMGDNSFNSYDSRYWGPVPEENLVGPGLFSLWPFSTGHWGLIK